MLNMTPPFENEDFDIEMKPPAPSNKDFKFKEENFKRIRMENSSDYVLCDEEDFNKAKYCKWYVKHKKVPFSEGNLTKNKKKDSKCDEKAGVKPYLLVPVSIVNSQGLTFEEYVGIKKTKTSTVFDKRRKK